MNDITNPDHLLNQTEAMDNKMELTFQLDFISQLIDNTKKINVSVEWTKKAFNHKGNFSQDENIKSFLNHNNEYIKYLEEVKKNLSQPTSAPLTGADLEKFKRENGSYQTRLEEFKGKTSIKLLCYENIEYNKKIKALNANLTGSSSALLNEDLHAEHKSIIREYHSRDRHPINTQTLKSLHEVIFGNNGKIKKSDIMKVLISADYENNNQNMKTKAKIFLKSHLGSNRHLAEREILNLISKLKMGDDSETAKHNSQILRTIHEISDKRLNGTPAPNKKEKAFLASIIRFTQDMVKITPGLSQPAVNETPVNLTKLDSAKETLSETLTQIGLRDINKTLQSTNRLRRP